MSSTLVRGSHSLDLLKLRTLRNIRRVSARGLISAPLACECSPRSRLSVAPIDVSAYWPVLPPRLPITGTVYGLLAGLATSPHPLSPAELVLARSLLPIRLGVASLQRRRGRSEVWRFCVVQQRVHRVPSSSTVGKYLTRCRVFIL